MAPPTSAPAPKRASASPAPPNAPKASTSKPSSTSTSTAPPPTSKPPKPDGSSSSRKEKEATPVPAPAKPANVFSSDGSFLDRFKTEAGEKEKAELALARKKAADDRFKNRGKRPSAPPAGEAEAEASKRAKLEEEMDPYLKEVQKASSNAALRGEGAPGRTYLK